MPIESNFNLISKRSCEMTKEDKIKCELLLDIMTTVDAGEYIEKFGIYGIKSMLIEIRNIIDKEDTK